MNNQELKYKRSKKLLSLKPGFTLVELIIYITLSVMIMGVVMKVYFTFQDSFRRTSEAHELNVQIQQAFMWLSQDLSSSSLMSIKVYPGTQPGLSFISSDGDSADSDNNKSKDLFGQTEYGSIKWNKYVFYTVIKNPEPLDERLGLYSGKLVRWEKPADKDIYIPLPTEILPSAFSGSSGGGYKLILDNLFVSIAKPEGLAGLTGLEMGDENYGGFRVSFVKKNEDPSASTGVILSSINPSEVSDDTKPGGITTSMNTDLVQVDLILANKSMAASKTYAYSFSFRVHPKY
jgi:type II secretory pathway pseudopilin PulG